MSVCARTRALVRPRARSAPLGSVWLVSLFILAATDLGAQSQAGTQVLLPTGGEHAVLWGRLRNFTEREDWDSVLEGLSRYVDLAQEPDVNSVVSSGGGYAVGVRRLYSQLVHRLPPPQRRSYRERLDTVVVPLWEEARESLPPRELSRLRHRLVRDYPESSLHRRLLRAEIDEAFEAGNWERAREACEDLLAVVLAQGPGAAEREAPPPDSEVAREVAGMVDRLRARLVLAQIFAARGDSDQLRTQIAALEKLRASEAFGGLSERLQAEVARTVESAPLVLESHLIRRREIPSSGLDPRVVRVDPKPSSEEPVRPFRLGRILWQKSVPRSPIRPMVDELSRDADMGNVPLPYHAAAVGQVILFQHSDRVVAYDIGRQIESWSVELVPDTLAFSGVRVPVLGPRTAYVVSGQAVLALDRASGSLEWTTSFAYDPDSKRLVSRSSLDEAGAAAQSEVEGDEAGDPTGAAGGDETGAAGRRGEAQGGALCLLTPPSVCADGLIVALTVRVNYDSRLYVVCLDPRGRELWTTFLGSTGSANYLGLGSLSSPPLCHGTSVYVLSNQGLLAALDGQDGAIRWILEYSTLSTRAQIEAIRTSNRWQPNPIVRVGQTLLIAPGDSAQLLAVDRETGAEIWRRRRERNSTLVGVNEDAVIVAGQTSAAIAHSGPRQGTVLWKRHSEEMNFAPLGRGALTPAGLVLPGRDNLLVLSLLDGSVISRSLWDLGGGGNVLLTGRLLAVSTPESLLVYGDREAQEKHIDQLDGTSPEALLTRCKYFLRHYEIDRALAELERWARSSPPPPSPNSELDSLHVDVAELIHYLSGVPVGAGRASLLLRYRFLLERTPERKVKAAIELAKKLEEEDDLVGALSVCHEALVHDRGRTEIVPEEFKSDAVASEGVLPIDGEAYLRDRIRQIRRRVERPDREFVAVESRAADALKEAHGTSTTLAYEEVIRLFPYTRAAAQAYLDLAQGYRDRLSYVQAIEALKGYLHDYADEPHTDAREVLRVELVLINLLSHVGQRLEAKERSIDVIERYGDRVATGVAGMKPDETVREYLEPRLRDPGFAHLPPAEPKTLRSPLGMAWRSPADLEAINRRFLVVEGSAPAALEGCFLTQSSDFVECRDASNGLSRWRLSLKKLIPGFVSDAQSYFAPLPRSGPKALRGRFEDGRLVLYDQHNLFAVDAIKGIVRWHIPFGPKTPATGSGRIRAPKLRERLRRVLIGSSGIYAVSSERKLYHLNLAGEKLWEHQLSYSPAPFTSPILAHNKLFVHSRQPPGISVHDALTGEKLGTIGNQSVVLDPIELPGGRVLLPYHDRVEMLDLATERVVWDFDPPGARSTIENIEYFEDYPGECVVVYNRLNNAPALVGVSLRTGEERWRHEKEFAARSSRFTVFRQGQQLYVIYGDHSWNLICLELRPGAVVDKPVIAPVWPGVKQKLGTFYSGASARRLYIGSDIIVFHDPNNSISIYDRSQGTPRPAVAEAINKFLIEKGGFASSVVGDKLIILTDGGDCAFEPIPDGPNDDRQSPANTDLVRAWLREPSSADRLIELAGAYFRKDRLKAAIDLLDRALISEEGLAGQSQKEQLRVRYMLDGLKQERMERQFKLENEAPSVRTRHLPTAPVVDGELNDWWDIGSRIRLETPQYVGTVPGPQGLKHWEGEEDLSAILYTGWDETYFYFALDVTDDVLYPYDRDADRWKGDCLIIGLDPTGNMGYRQTGNDQLMTLALTLPKRRNDDKKTDEEGQGEDEEEDEEQEGKPDGLFAVKRKTDNTGAIYEVGLPWTSFTDDSTGDRPPYRGYAFGLSLLLTDDDTGQGASKTLSINPCQLLPDSQKSSLVWRFIIPNFFPRIRLE